jgi:hypothetical protein
MSNYSDEVFGRILIAVETHILEYVKQAGRAHSADEKI